MKTASMVLGIIGGVLISIFSFLFLFGAIATTELFYSWNSPGTEAFFALGIGSLLLAAFGIVGGALAKNHRIAAGVLLIIAAVICMISLIAMLPGIMFLIAAIFAFIKEQPPAPRPYQQPYYQQPQYYYRQPQQPPYPQQPQPLPQQNQQQPQQPPEDKF